MHSRPVIEAIAPLQETVLRRLQGIRSAVTLAALRISVCAVVCVSPWAGSQDALAAPPAAGGFSGFNGATAGETSARRPTASAPT